MTDRRTNRQTDGQDPWYGLLGRRQNKNVEERRGNNGTYWKDFHDNRGTQQGCFTHALTEWFVSADQRVGSTAKMMLVITDTDSSILSQCKPASAVITLASLASTSCYFFFATAYAEKGEPWHAKLCLFFCCYWFSVNKGLWVLVLGEAA